MTEKLAMWERVAIPALVSIVPKSYIPLVDYEGWRAQLRWGPTGFMLGMREELFRAAYAAWRAQ